MIRDLEIFHLGQIDYETGRKIQEDLILRRKRGECADTLLLCEHPPVITLGKRTDSSHLHQQLIQGRIRTVRADRGGAATYHGPGQLILYPVVCLRENQMGVRSFVTFGLNAIRHALNEIGVSANTSLDPAGLWVGSSKIAAVGLRIVEGITNHGFSVNVNCDLLGFEGIVPCGISGLTLTSVAKELGRDFDIAKLLPHMSGAWLRASEVSKVTFAQEVAADRVENG